MAEFLPGPFEILELPGGQPVEFTIVDKLLGDMVIHPRGVGAPAEKIIRGLRIHTAPGPGTSSIGYWDVTAGTLIVQLLPLLAGTPPAKVRVKIEATGVAPAKRFSVTRL